MNSPLGKRKVRLRGLGGRPLCGDPYTCASAAGLSSEPTPRLLIRHTLEATPALDDPDPWSGEVASGVGTELGTGAELRLGRMLGMTPGIRYVRYGGGDDGVAMPVGEVGLMPNPEKDRDFLRERTSRSCRLHFTGARPKDLLAATRWPDQGTGPASAFC